MDTDKPKPEIRDARHETRIKRQGRCALSRRSGAKADAVPRCIALDTRHSSLDTFYAACRVAQLYAAFADGALR